MASNMLPLRRKFIHSSLILLLLFPLCFTQSIVQELSFAYGPKKLSDFGLTEFSMKGSVTDSQQAGLHTICSNYDKAAQTQQYLYDHIGEDYFHPQYVSKKDNTICFMAILNESTLIDFKKMNFMRSIIRTPLPLILHESSLSLIPMSSGSLTPAKIRENQYLRAFHQSNKTSVLSEAKIIITFGVGVVGKHGVVHDANKLTQNRITVHEIRQTLHRRNPTRDLQTFVDHSSQHVDIGHESLSIWLRAYQTMQSLGTSSIHPDAPFCPDKELSLEFITPSQLMISNLQEYFQSSSDLNRQSCIMSLLSHFLTSYADVISDIRLQFPKYPNNHFNKGIVQTRVYVENNYPYHDVGLDGTGQIVGVGDTGLDELSCFFRNSDSSLVARSSIHNPTFDLSKRKVIQYINYADGRDLPGGHGTHVAGTIAGSSRGFVSAGIKYGGHASGAKIAFFDMELSTSPFSGLRIPSPMANFVFQPAYDAGARIHSNSWGSPLNMIDSDDLTVDSFQYRNDDFLAIFAAGNEGAEGFYSLGQPGTTKNSVTVGASRSDSSTEISRVAFFSSLGPTFDERIKPDVVAPGYFTTSVFASPFAASCSIVDMAGTSMAAPLVSGVAAQIRQYFQTFNTTVITSGCSYFGGSGSLSALTCDHLSNPKGATVKALLIHSGELMSQYDSESRTTVQGSVPLVGTPDVYQGYGRVTLPNILPYPGIESILHLHVIETNIYSYQEIVHTVQVHDITRPMKATIVWMDPDNTIMTNKMLLNNLDLKVITPTGKILYGNNISGDEINNVEQVLILNPPLGQYSVIVTSSYLVTQKQNFSLIVTGGNISFISHDASVPSTLVSSYNPYNCHEDERYVVLTALDHGGNGWGTGNSYEIRDISDNTLVNSGTLSNKAGEQSRKIIPLCLQSNRNYSISLITNGTDSDSDEMGLEISPCNIFLSKYMTSSTFTISSTTMSSYCGDCENKFKLQILLSGSFYGVPYGWNQPSHYILWNSVNSNMIYSGTLITGMYSLHSYCLTSEIWYLEFSDVPSNDDGFITNSNIAQIFGVEEYLMTVTDGINEVSISPGQRTTIIVNGTSATLSIGSVAPTSSPTFAPTRSPSVSPSATPSKLCTSFDIEVSK